MEGGHLLDHVKYFISFLPHHHRDVRLIKNYIMAEFYDDPVKSLEACRINRSSSCTVCQNVRSLLGKRSRWGRRLAVVLFMSLSACSTSQIKKRWLASKAVRRPPTTIWRKIGKPYLWAWPSNYFLTKMANFFQELKGIHRFILFICLFLFVWAFQRMTSLSPISYLGVIIFSNVPKVGHCREWHGRDWTLNLCFTCYGHQLFTSPFKSHHLGLLVSCLMTPLFLPSLCCSPSCPKHPCTELYSFLTRSLNELLSAFALWRDRAVTKEWKPKYRALLPSTWARGEPFSSR